MRKILCYGDSNTFGFVPETGGRYDKNTRWSGLLGKFLDKEYEVIEQGMNNRTGFFKSSEGLQHSGGEYLPVLLQNYRDIDIFILALGTNDVQFFYDLNKNTVSCGLQKLIDIIKKINSETGIIIVPPVKIKENIIKGYFSNQFDIHSVEKMQEVFPLFKQKAEENNCFYFNFNEFVKPSEVDGLHYSAESHRIIAEKLAGFITDVVELGDIVFKSQTDYNQCSKGSLKC